MNQGDYLWYFKVNLKLQVCISIPCRAQTCPLRIVLIVSAIRNSNTQSIILLKPAFMNAKLTLSQRIVDVDTIFFQVCIVHDSYIGIHLMEYSKKNFIFIDESKHFPSKYLRKRRERTHIRSPKDTSE